ncbi:hypothetical protein VNO80_03035 [Phaseolus coccineus]|uniref:Uncharacterized protein n=1 Tax=Phaseolus coccineus TaxID=3886 RepID=A0AAN9NRG9_PHACN
MSQEPSSTPNLNVQAMSLSNPSNPSAHNQPKFLKPSENVSQEPQSTPNLNVVFSHLQLGGQFDFSFSN